MDATHAEADDEEYLCKKCKQVLEAGRAFELGGNRWHIKCFRCSKCDSQLPGENNLLVLGDGNLLCRTCSYHCVICETKISDLAILTAPDQAYCANCFRCRNCKRSIDNLRYAKTGQGIFCLKCHEALVARRKRRAAERLREREQREQRERDASRPRTSTSSGHDEPNVDKRLPSIPPPAPPPPERSLSDPGRAERPPAPDKDRLPPVPDAADKPDGPRTISTPISTHSAPDDAHPDAPVLANPFQRAASGPIAPAPSAAPAPHTATGVPPPPIVRATSISTDILDNYGPSAGSFSGSSGRQPSVNTLPEEPVPELPAVPSPSRSQSTQTLGTDIDKDELPGPAPRLEMAAGVSAAPPPAPTVPTFASADAAPPIKKGFKFPSRTLSTKSTSGESARSRRKAERDSASSTADSFESSSSSLHMTAYDFLAADDPLAKSSGPSIKSSSTSSDILASYTAAEPAPALPAEAPVTASSSVSSASANFHGGQIGPASQKPTRLLMSPLPSPLSGSFSSAASNISRQSKGFLSDLGKRPNLSKVARRISRSVSYSETASPELLQHLDADGSVREADEAERPSLDRSGSLSGRGLSASPSIISFGTVNSTDTIRNTSLRSASPERDDERPAEPAAGLFRSARTRGRSASRGEPTHAATFPVFDSDSVHASMAAPKSAFNFQSQVAEPGIAGRKYRKTSGGSGLSRRSPSIGSTILHSITSSFGSAANVGHASALSNSSVSSVKSAPLSQTNAKFFRKGSAASKESTSSTNSSLRPVTPPEKAGDEPYLGHKPAAGSSGHKDTEEDGSTLSSSTPRTPKEKQGEKFLDNSDFATNISLSFFPSTGGFSLDEDFANILNNQKTYSPRRVRRPSRSTPGPEAMESPQLGADQGSVSPLTAGSKANAGADAGFPAFSADRSALLSSPTFDRADENTALKYELARSSQRIVELEARLKAGHPDVDRLDVLASEKRQTVANLQAQVEVARSELGVLQGPASRAETKAAGEGSDLIQQFTADLEQTKQGLQTEIENLIVQRNELLDENMRLSKLRDQISIETHHLSAKHAQLKDVNVALSREMQRLQTETKLLQSRGFGPALRAKDADDFSYERYSYETSVSSVTAVPSTPSVNSTAATTPNLASLDRAFDDGLVSVAHPQPIFLHTSTATNVPVKKSKWRKGGAAMGKGLKGFNKIFSADHPHLETSGPYNAHAPAEPSSQYPGPNALNIMIPMSKSNSTGTITAAINNVASGLSTDLETASTKSSGSSGKGSSGSAGSGVGASAGSGLLRGMKMKVSAAVSSQAGADEVRMIDPTRADNGSLSKLVGVTLEDRVALEARDIPLIVTRCIAEVEHRGLEFEGVYRKSGGKSHMSRIQDAFERADAATEDGELAIADAIEGDISGATSVLKQYLRYLPVPLVTYDAYMSFITVAEIGNEGGKVEKLRDVIFTLPACHRRCLEFLMEHLQNVREASAVNLMTSRNLAVVFAPTLVRDKTGAREMVDMQKKNDVIQFLIENWREVFGKKI
ncbi:uncharacterized protein V1510DRAFT_403547 [Dipodascopsis tothii]|uniref:uncharacterized protein n=1 Tax=Dipodascopsis tothii TaxID=44089 RepID=UPI0034CD5C82